MRPILHALPALWLACGAAAQPMVPMLPPTPPALTAPQGALTAPRPVALAGPLQVRAGASPAPSPAQQARIEELVQEVFAQLPELVLLDAAPTGTGTPAEGYATNLLTTPPEATVRVRLGLEAVRDQGRFALETVPVQVELIDGEGLSIAGRMLDYQPMDEGSFRAELTDFLAQHLEIEPNSGGTDPTAPVLEVWLGQEEGDSVVYFRGGAEGYISLYLSAPEQPVRRLFPDQALPVNRVQPGRIYRYPAIGGLKVAGGRIRAVLTIPPSNTAQPGAAGEALRIIPTQQPVLFANQDLSLIFSLPGFLYNETQLVLPDEPQ